MLACKVTVVATVAAKIIVVVSIFKLKFTILFVVRMMKIGKITQITKPTVVENEIRLYVGLLCRLFGLRHSAGFLLCGAIWFCRSRVTFSFWWSVYTVFFRAVFRSFRFLQQTRIQFLLLQIKYNTRFKTSFIPKYEYVCIQVSQKKNVDNINDSTIYSIFKLSIKPTNFINSLSFCENSRSL